MATVIVFIYKAIRPMYTFSAEITRKFFLVFVPRFLSFHIFPITRIRTKLLRFIFGFKLFFTTRTSFHYVSPFVFVFALILTFFNPFVKPSFAGIISMPQYGPKSTLTSSNLNQRWNLLTNEVNSGLDNTNADTTNGFRFHEILGSLPAAGNQGRTVFLTTDDTLYFDDGNSFRGVAVLSNNQTFTGNNTFNGTDTFTDLIAATADINDGTLDNVQIGGTTATGELFVNNASDAADGLGSQGLSGQVLVSGGTDANPSWAYRSEIFTTVGADTFTTEKGVTKVWVYMLGGGGGGGGADGSYGGGGGGAGGAVDGIAYNVAAETGYAVVVGDGGAGGGADATGSAGAASTFNAVLTAPGGGGGGAGSTGEVGLSGTAGVGAAEVNAVSNGTARAGKSIQLSSEAGGNGAQTNSSSGQDGGGGGAPRFLGAGADGSNLSAGAGDAAANNSGGGGGGGAITNGVGGKGGSGIVIIRW